MRGKQLFFSIFVLTLVLTLALSACQTAPKPPTTPTPTAKPTPTSTPTPSPTTKPHEIVNIEMYSASIGSSAYIITHALADILNKNHPWIRATALEALGGIDGMKTVIKSPPAKRKLQVCFSSDINLIEAQDGVGPFEGLKYDLRLLSNSYVINGFMISTDKNIRSKADLVGKKVASGGPVGSSRSQLAEFITWDAWGLKDKITLQYIGITESKNALADGLVSSMFVSAFQRKTGEKYSPDAILPELMGIRTVYALPVDKADWEKGLTTSPRKWGWSIMPKDAVGPGFPDKDQGALLFANAWFVPIDMDPEITYEVAKTITNYHAKFVEYADLAKSLYPEMQAVGIWKENLVHPGALKWYKEKGLKIGG